MKLWIKKKGKYVPLPIESLKKTDRKKRMPAIYIGTKKGKKRKL